MAIIEASHNVIMLHMLRSMFDLLREGVFYNRQVMFKNRMTREQLLDQHRAINAGGAGARPGCRPGGGRGASDLCRTGAASTRCAPKSTKPSPGSSWSMSDSR